MVAAYADRREHAGLLASTQVHVVKSWDEAPFEDMLPEMRAGAEKFFYEHAKHGWRNGLVEHSYAEYPWINHAKVGWVKRAVESNAFNSDYFFWIDAGYGRYQNFTQHMCPCLAINPDKVTVFSHGATATAQEYRGPIEGWVTTDGTQTKQHDIADYFRDGHILAPGQRRTTFSCSCFYMFSSSTLPTGLCNVSLTHGSCAHKPLVARTQVGTGVRCTVGSGVGGRKRCSSSRNCTPTCSKS